MLWLSTKLKNVKFDDCIIFHISDNIVLHDYTAVNVLESFTRIFVYEFDFTIP